VLVAPTAQIALELLARARPSRGSGHAYPVSELVRSRNGRSR
jgi:hypothetical protein